VKGFLQEPKDFSMCFRVDFQRKAQYLMPIPEAEDGQPETMVFGHNDKFCSASFDFIETISQTRALFKFLWYVLQPIHLKDIEVNLSHYFYVSIRSSLICFYLVVFAKLCLLMFRTQSTS
jgi:hypothetical protein